MAKLDLNSRYGSYAADAAIGGYDRKELRGLSKQAKRGTLTQRERARYKYLKDERRGRRKRGLLAGLGGVGTTLAALAAAGKLGGLGGGGGGGEGKDRARALMESIRGRLAKGKANLQDKADLARLARDKRWAEKHGFDPREYDDSAEIEEESKLSERNRIDEELARNVDFKRVGGSQLQADQLSLPSLDVYDWDRNPDGTYTLDPSKTKIEKEKAKRVTDERDFSDVLSEELGEGDLYEAQQEAERQARLARRPEFASGSNLDPYLMPTQRQDEFMPQGPIKQTKQAGPTALSELLDSLSPDDSFEEEDGPIFEVSDEDLNLDDKFSNSPTNINEVTGLKSRSVDLGSDFPAELPARTNIRPIEYSNNESPAVDPNDALTGIFQRTGSRPVRANSVDPMGLLGGDSRDENVSEAQREEDAVEFLSLLNRRRVEKGLPEVNKITMDAIKETGRSTSELMTSRPARQILNRYR